jgi:hypothetical protein
VPCAAAAVSREGLPAPDNAVAAVRATKRIEKKSQRAGNDSIRTETLAVLRRFTIFIDR